MRTAFDPFMPNRISHGQYGEITTANWGLATTNHGYQLEQSISV